MSYQLKEVSIRTDNSPAGTEQISELWADITSGKLPVLFDSNGQFLPGVSPVSRYSNYASDETGAYDLTILGVQSDFFAQLEGQVAAGAYRKYDFAGDDLLSCTQAAWNAVWTAQKDGSIKRRFTCDYESSVPAEYTKDKKAHCYLYIAVE